MSRRAVLVLLGIGAAAWGAAAWDGAGRHLWHPYYLTIAGPRTHEQVLGHLGPQCRPRLRESVASLGLAYPPSRLTLVGLKADRALEVWAAADAGWRLVRTYPILAASGRPGPKLREGDLQVPEGVYRLTGFNPNSNYHLSMRVDYPSAHDRAVARAEGREKLGGDIFIHGKSVSIGCVAIGDAAIEELYVLVADVGLARTRLLLAPSSAPTAEPASPRWIAELYDRLRAELRGVRGVAAAGVRQGELPEE